MQAQVQTNSYVPRNDRSILEFIDPSKEIKKIMLEFLGFQEVFSKQSGVTTVYLKRVNKPLFTDEFVRGLIKDIQQFVNFTTQVSRFKEQRIQMHVGEYLLTLKESFATRGDDHYISDQTWARILEIHNAKEQYLDANNETQYRSGWNGVGIGWEYDKAVRKEMLDYGVKDYNEECDQAIEFERQIRALAPFLEASLAKSFSGDRDALGMMLRALGEIRTERQTFSEQKPSGSSIFGMGGNKQEKKEWR